MFRNVLDNLNAYIKERVKTLSGEELYDLKQGFYDKCFEFMGHNRNLTGVTELLVNLYLTHFHESNFLSYTIQRNYKKRGYNGHENELDIAFLNEPNWIQYGFSVKHRQEGASWKDHEKTSEVCKSFISAYGKNNITQDLYRMDNIKRGINGSFPSVTFIFEKIMDTNKIKEIENTTEFNHSYIILQGNPNRLWDEVSWKLHLDREPLLRE